MTKSRSCTFYNQLWQLLIAIRPPVHRWLTNVTDGRIGFAYDVEDLAKLNDLSPQKDATGSKLVMQIPD